MAKFGFWNPETQEPDETRDDFTVLHSWIEYYVEGECYYPSQEIRQAVVFIHDRSGIVTTDPVAFEKWLESIER